MTYYFSTIVVPANIVPMSVALPCNAHISYFHENFGIFCDVSVNKCEIPMKMLAAMCPDNLENKIRQNVDFY